MSEIKISTGHPDAGRLYAQAFERVTAERDALQKLLNAQDERVDVLEGLLRECAAEFNTSEASTFEVEMRKRIDAALSARAEPAKSCGACGGCDDSCKLDRESPPVERDERAEFEARYHLHTLIRDGVSGSYINAQVRDLWDAWQARAALDKATEGASHE